MKKKEELFASDKMFKTMLQNECGLEYSAKFLYYFIEVDYELLLSILHLVKNSFSKKKSNERNRVGDYVAQIDENYIAIQVNNNERFDIIKKYGI